jgi:uridine phosphorylase
MSRYRVWGEGRGRWPLAPSPSNQNDAIINPVREAWEAPVSARVILTFARPDYQLLCRLTGAKGPPRYLWDCALRPGSWDGRPVTIVAPAPGAPYAVLVLEKLIALGARLVLALGWCGSLKAGLRIGALVLPTSALCGDGTSRHYLQGEGEAQPHPALNGLLQAQLQASPAPWQGGPVWTTDAFYRETPELVRHYQGQGVLGVDMEMAALFAVGWFRQVAVAGLLVVSDELFTLSWRAGYRSVSFRQARDLAARLLLAAAVAWEDQNV